MNNSTHTRIMGALLTALVVIGTAGLSVGASPPMPAQPPQSMRGAPLVLLAGHGQHPFRVAPPTGFSLLHAQNSTMISVNYLPPGTTNALGDDCLTWPSGSQAAFSYAASIWASLLNSTVPIKINACWANLDYGVLGHSAAEGFYRDFFGAPVAGTWYPVALANALSGTDLNDVDGTDDDGFNDDADAEMEIAYSSNGISWYFGTDGNTPMGQYDFVSVVLHEICHALGFDGTMQVSSGLGYWGWDTGYPAIYDRFTENGFGTGLLTYLSGSSALATQLTSNNVYFDGPNANAANGNNRPKLYAPSTWQPGSSYAHLDETFNGTENALMTYSLDDGESVHNPGPVTQGILKDLGWIVGVPAPNVGIVKQVLGSDLNPGDRITFTLTISNSGSAVASNVVITDAVPAQVLTPTYASITRTGALTYVWNVAPLGVGAGGVISIYGWIDPALESGFSFMNTATISDPQDSTPGNNSSTVIVGVQRVYLPLVVRNWPPLVTNTFYSVGDACVLQGRPTMNFGSTTDMWAGYDDYLNPDGMIARSLVRFNLSAIPSGATVNSATLRAYLVGSYDYPGRTRTVTAYRAGSTWSESSVTWNSQPAIAEAYGSSGVTHGAQGWYSFDVTNLVRGWVNGSLQNYGIVLRGPEWSGSDSSWKAFSTREGPYPPQLVITYIDYSASMIGGAGYEGSGTGQPVGSIFGALAAETSTDLLSASLCQSHLLADGKCLVLP